MTRTLRFSVLVAVAIAAIALGFVTSTARADTSLPITAEFSVHDPAAAPDLSAFDDSMVIDEAEFRELSDAVQRITPHITVDDEGLPQLEGVTAADLGVSEEFLRNFKRAMEFSNEAIAKGEFEVNDDLTIEVLGPAASSLPSADLVPAGEDKPVGPLQTVGDETVEWSSWNYPNQGAMFYNSYYDYWNYYHNRYYVLCNGMAAALGYPWMSTNLMYFYGYNGWYFQRYCYQGYGMYFYLPYSQGCCRMYNPCWCGGMCYRVVYIWVRVVQYNPMCRCYQYNWNWTGYWGRY